MLRLVSPILLLAACRQEAQATPTAEDAVPAPSAVLVVPVPVPEHVAALDPIPVPEPAEAVPVQAEPEPHELRTAPRELAVRTRPAHDAPLRGYTGENGVFRVLRRVDPAPGKGACKEGWAELEAKGYACLDGTKVVDSKPVAWPPLVTFDPPDPTEFTHYRETGEYDHSQPEALVPAVYAKRWGRFKGRMYTSKEAFLRGDSPAGQLDPRVGMKYRFEHILETEKGPLITRDDGQVARLDDVYLYPITRHQGRDLGKDPLPAGQWPAFAIAYEGTAIYSEPREEASVLRTVPYHAPLVIEQKPADAAGTWWKLPEGGYVNDWRGIRHPVPLPGRPSGVKDDELWVDVELGQQVLTVYRGDEMVYFTVVSTGAAPMGTPRGTYQILGMYAFKNMASREGAEDVYFVEDVPWTMVFKPAYALHAAYWHWGFGRPASHGCVNLAPRDAAWIFSNLEPRLPDGWRVILPIAAQDTEPREPSTVVRVRRGEDVGEDKRGI
jgi:hypothetical protein